MANAFVLEITESNFDEKVLQADKTVLIDFWAPWCGPCRQVAPVIDAIAQEFNGRAYVGKINVDDNMGLAQRYGVMSIPTLMVIKGGKTVETVLGARSKEDISAMLAAHL